VAAMSAWTRWIALWQRLPELARDTLLAALLGAAFEAELWLEVSPGGHAPIVNAILFPFFGLALALRRRLPLVPALGVGALTLAQVVLGGSVNDGVGPLVAGVLAMFSLGYHATTRTALLGLAGTLLLVATSILVLGHAGEIVFAVLVFLLPWLAGIGLQAREDRAGSRTRRAVAEERARMARDLHDVISHGVGVMVVQASGARRVIGTDPARAQSSLVAIEATGREALVELQHLLGLLRDAQPDQGLAPQPDLGQLDRLVEQLRAAGLNLEWSIEGDRAPLPPGIGITAYRVIQEALTNVMKHAPQASAEVCLRYGSSLELEIVNDGAPMALRKGLGGHGLIGMRERIQLYGGRLEAGPRPEGGFAVRAWLPLNGAAK
jgi:signal transduction histidine kinase